jgi:hypothetical protein
MMFSKQAILRAIKNMTNHEALYLNSGNCGVFAVALNNVLDGKGKYMVAIESDEPEYIAHVALKYKGMLIDGTGITTYKHMELYAHGGDPEKRVNIIETDERDVLRNTNSSISVAELEYKLRKELAKVNE